MTRTTTRRQSDPGTGPFWLLHGATGLLQPLSESFLYRSPTESRNLTSWVRRADPVDHDVHV